MLYREDGRKKICEKKILSRCTKDRAEREKERKGGNSDTVIFLVLALFTHKKNMVLRAARNLDNYKKNYLQTYTYIILLT